MRLIVQEIGSTDRYGIRFKHTPREKFFTAQIRKYTLGVASDKVTKWWTPEKLAGSTIIIGPFHLIELGNHVEYHFIEKFNFTDKLIMCEKLQDISGPITQTITLNYAVANTCSLIHRGEPVAFSTVTGIPTPMGFPIHPRIADHMADSIAMGARAMGKSMHSFGIGLDATVRSWGDGKGSIDMSGLGDVSKEVSKELKVSPLAKSGMLDKFLEPKRFGGITISPELAKTLKDFSADSE